MGAPTTTLAADCTEAVAPSEQALPRAVRWLPPLFRPTFEELLPRTRTERRRRDWVFDVLAFVLTLAMGAITHHATSTTPGEISGLREIVDVGLVPVAATSLFWRRRWPLHIAVLTGTLTVISPASGMAAVFAAFAVAAYAPPATALIGLGVLVVTGPLSAFLARDVSTDPWLSTAIFCVLFMVGIGAWGMFTGTRRQLLVTLHERARRAEAEQGLRIEQARQQERTRIAREMHDVLAHRMSLLSVHAGALEYRPDAPPEAVVKAAGVIRQTAHEALEELRTVIGVLRVDELVGDGAAAAAPEAPQPTLAQVPVLLDEWRAAGVRIDLQLDIDPHTVPDAIGRTAYRVVQEALTNASKHAPSTRVQIRLTGAPGESLSVVVTNPLAVAGSTTDVPGTGLGLVGLRERTELAGGTFSTEADLAARMFVLRAVLPWEPS